MVHGCQKVEFPVFVIVANPLTVDADGAVMFNKQTRFLVEAGDGAARIVRTFDTEERCCQHMEEHGLHSEYACAEIQTPDRLTDVIDLVRSEYPRDFIGLRHNGLG